MSVAEPSYLHMTEDERAAQAWERAAEVAAMLPTGNAVDPVDGATPWGSWADVDLEDALLGKGPPPPDVGTLTTGVSLYYGGKVNDVHGEPESGKGWLVAHAAAQVLTAGGHVIWIDYEDSATTLVHRLRLLGVTDHDVIRNQLHYKRPHEAIGERLPLLVEQARGCSLVVIDGITEAFAHHGLDPQRETDVAKFDSNLPRPLARAGPAVVGIDHVVKSKETRGRWQSGSGHKLALVDGASYLVGDGKPFAIGRSGYAKVIVAKDRNGHWRRGDTAAILDVTAYPDGGIGIDLRPDDSHTPEGRFRPTVLMGRCWRLVRDWEGSAQPSKSQIRSGVTGDNGAIDTALDRLIEEGYLELVVDGQAQRHHLTDLEWNDPE